MILSYAAERQHIQNGDVLLYRGQGPVSSIIRWATGSTYSHAGLAVWWNERLMVMEAMRRGVRVTTLSFNLNHYNGSVEWYTSHSPIPADQRLDLIRYAQLELGKRYAFWSVFKLGLLVLFGGHIDPQDELARNDTLFCSLYVANCYNAIGIDLKKNHNDRFMTPGDIAESPVLYFKGELSHIRPSN
jgi:hypothetical protein